MKRIVIVIVAAVVSMPALAWGPGDDAGGEPPGPQTFEQGSQPQCFAPGDTWDEWFPTLACGYVPPSVKPPIGWTPVPPIFVPTPPVPEPATWVQILAGLALVVLVVLLRRRK